MNCNCNNATLPIPTGAVNINLGVFEANAALNIIFVTATGRMDVVACTCNGQGDIIFPNPLLRIGVPYNVSIALQNDATQAQRQWTCDNETGITCVNLEFIEAEVSDGVDWDIAEFVVTLG